MKASLVSSSLRVAALAVALLVVPAIASASESACADRASELLTSKGSIAVKAVGPYVEEGTSLIQVSVTLGHPSAKLADGTWLYQNHQVEGSDARGTLVVRFNKGHVSEMSLVTPAVATAMMSPTKSADKMQVASR